MGIGASGIALGLVMAWLIPILSERCPPAKWLAYCMWAFASTPSLEIAAIHAKHTNR
jgi:hypothetical protein